MPFAYYQRLSPAQRAIYRQSDRIVNLPLPEPSALRPLAAAVEVALADERRSRVQSICQQLTDGLLQQLQAPAVKILVREVRPSSDREELHGLYEPASPPHRARISLWMRTARRGQVVAFRSFLRTLLHELCHHLDYELLTLEESFHTEGFYKRESSLFRQLVSDRR